MKSQPLGAIFSHGQVHSFDVILLVAIILSLMVAMLDTVSIIHGRYGTLLYGIDLLTLFTLVIVKGTLMHLIEGPKRNSLSLRLPRKRVRC